MTSQEMILLLDELRSLPSENEWLEFKKAQNDFHFDEIGKYFSALSNEANLKGKASAWLIFGVDDKTHTITGTQYRAATGALESLKHEIADQTTNRISFADIQELALPEGRVIMFEIPPCPARCAGGLEKPLLWARRRIAGGIESGKARTNPASAAGGLVGCYLRAGNDG